MYRILIADDEYWAGRWLDQVLKEGPLPVAVTGISESAEETLEELMKEGVDILITDINMPIMSGLDVLKRLQEAGKRLPKTIVVSGYDEFEYARQAIGLNVLEYLLKPLERSAVYEAVIKAMKLLDGEREQSLQSRGGRSASIETMLGEYMRNPGLKLMERLKESLPKEAFAGSFYEAAIFQMRLLKQSKPSGEELKKHLKMAAPGKGIYLCFLDKFTWGVLIGGIENPAGFRINESALVSILHSYEFGLSQAHEDLGQLDEAFEEAKRAIILRFRRKDGAQERRVSEADLHIGFLSALKAGNMTRIEECTRDACGLFASWNYDLTGCLNFYFVLAGEVIKLLNDRYGEQSRTKYLSLIEEGYDFSVRIRNYYSIRSICLGFEEYIGKAAACLKEECMAVSAIVKQVQQTIRWEYGSDLSLAGLADEYGINPSYFSKKFKEETGINFIDYLTGIRVEQARGLLHDTELSVSAIGRQVGFKEGKYFSRVFASATGERPTQYRERRKREDGGQADGKT